MNCSVPLPELAGIAVLSFVVALVTVEARGAAPDSTLDTGNRSSGSTSKRELPLSKMRLTAILGSTLENQGGIKLGTVKDMALDSQTGQAQYVFVASGGFAGIGSKWKVVPIEAIFTYTSKKNTVGVNLRHDAWNAAPAILKSQLSSLNAPGRKAEIIAFYREGMPRIFKNDRAPEPCGEYQQPLNLRLARPLLGASVRDDARQRLGNILDFLIDPGGCRPTLMLLSAPGQLESGQALVLPANALALHGGKELMLPPESTGFSTALPFNPQTWVHADHMVPTILQMDKNGK